MVPAVESAVHILGFVDDHPNSTGAQVYRALDLNPSTCHGVLKTLSAHGYLDFDPANKTYRLGPALWVLGRRAWSGSNATEHLQPFLRQWSGANSFTIFLARYLAGPQEFVVVDKVESSQLIKVTVDLGERFPLGAAALGKAYLAWCPPELSDGFLSSGSLPAFTEGSITSVAAFRDELVRARERGWAESRAEYYSHTNAVSAAVVDPRGEVAWVVCGLGATSEMPESTLDEHGASIARVAGEITAYLNGRELAASAQIGIAG
jgi:DNA-binding IclR family transcriptional regulator